MRIVGFVNPALAQFQDGLLHSPVIDFVPTNIVSDLRQRVVGADAVVVSNSTYNAEVADIISSIDTIRWIQVTSIGVDTLARHRPRKEVIVTNAAGLKAGIVAEHAVALLLALMRNLPAAIEAQGHHRWQADTLAPHIRSLAGLRVVCLGYGSVGREIARKLGAFDADVIALTRSGIGAPPVSPVMSLDRLLDILPSADAVMLALPLAARTRGIFGKKELAVLKPSALLVNVGRGELVDEPALLDALWESRIGGAALDVVVNEPLPPSSPLWRCPRLLITPHVGGQGGNGDRRLVDLMEENVGRLKRGEQLINVVDFL